MTQLTPPYPLICDGLRKGQVIPFLGSGASLSTLKPGAKWDASLAECLPSSNQLAQHLAHKTSFPENRELLELAKVAQYYDVIGGRDALHGELHLIFNRDYPYTSLHSFLASVEIPLLIVTTNYDDLIERAFSENNAFSENKRKYDVVVHTTDPSVGERILWWPHGESDPIQVNPGKLDIDMQSVTVIYKMHGAVDRREPTRDQYVITEDDYIDFLARMIKNRAIPAIFARPFQTRHFLFLGYSLGDWNLRVVLNRLEKDARRRKSIKSWAFRDKPPLLEQRFWQERGVEVYDMMLDDCVKELTSHCKSSGRQP